MSKYGSRKTIIDGISFDSKREATRYQELKYQLDGGFISDLQLQVPYEIIPKQRDSKGKAVRATKYIADFVYKDREGKTVVEDTKGFRTESYKIKKKLMLHVFGIDVQEV